MLTHIAIKNFAISESLEVDFQPGMTVLTGETGAGKSIMLDALGLALGDRADSNVVRAGAERSDIHASFDLDNIPTAQQWLQTRELDAADECVLRRVITKEGRSRGYINGHTCTLQDMRELGNILIDIHSQHAHQSLLNKNYQRQLLDAFASTNTLCQKVNTHYQDYQKSGKVLEQLLSRQSESSAQAQLLRYQLDELERLTLDSGETHSLEQEQQQLCNAEQILATNQQGLQLCRDDDSNALSIIQQALSSLKGEPAQSASHQSAIELLESACIQIDEACNELQLVADKVEINPQRLAEVESRLDDIYQIARKHKLRPEQLPDLQTELEQDLAQLDSSDERCDALRQEQANSLLEYHKHAAALSKKRQAAAKKMKQKIEAQLSALAMKHCEIEFALTARDDTRAHQNGLEDVEILISTNPASNKGPLNKIASGGELSRISLAIQVVTAEVSAIPTVIFDEIDVGIGGATAEVVGKLLHTLSKRSQVLCVTHQPQVASQGDQHLRVLRAGPETQPRTELCPLDDIQKIDEIARMLGGIAITENTLAHAKEMLSIRH
ncbi:MAG: DNA repair protein RecN [Spongiibacteraceae bacterium]